jgi:hypothetical protein
MDKTQIENLFYQTDFICTYKLMDEEFTDDLYQIQLLQAFNLEKWDDALINNLCYELYILLMKPDTIFRDIIEKGKQNRDIKYIYDSIIQDNGAKGDDNGDEGDDKGDKNAKGEEGHDSIIFALLFTYDFFDLFHKCICEYFRNGVISLKTLENIMIKL